MAELEFYCCDCERIFNSEPDGTGYDQAPCPLCQHICMTSEFEGKSTRDVESAIRKVPVAEFIDEQSAEPVVELLEAAGIEVQIDLPDIGGDFITGGNDYVTILVPANTAKRARMIIDSAGE